MIPASFEYHRPKDMAGVLSLLEEHGDDARVMAGGHSLIPMMKLRMAHHTGRNATIAHRVYTGSSQLFGEPKQDRAI